MISKILLTLSIIVALVIFMRIKSQQQTVVTQSKPASRPVSEGEKMFRQGAWLFLIFMVISAGVFMYYEWDDRHATVNVHVINTRTGETITYQAEQKNIKGNQFTTLEGKTVYVADIERVEIEPR